MIRSVGKEEIIVGTGKIMAKLACDSDDVKPTSGVATGSTCLEVDTGDMYIFSEDDKEWYFLKNISGDSDSGGEGGGGDSDFSIAKVTLVGTDDAAFEVPTETPVSWPMIKDNILVIYGDNSHEIIEVPGEFNIPLFKGVFKASEIDPIPGYFIVRDENGQPITMGAINYDFDTEEWTVTGDCTIVLGSQK